jgi:integrase
MSKVLTSKFVENVKPPATGRSEYWDAALPGFVLRVTVKGVKSFSFRYRAADGSYKRLSWAYPAFQLSEARDEAQKAVRAIGRGQDPETGEKKPSAPETLNALCDRYVAEYLKKNVRRWEAAKGEIDNHVRPHLGALKLEKVEKANVRKMLAEIEPNYPVAANRALGRLRAIYNWALENDLVATDPTHGVKKPTKEKPVSRTLSDEELAKIWNAAASLSYPAREYIRFLILSGQRRDDVRGMCRDELDMRMGNWLIPAERYKSVRSHLIPLTDGMKELLKVTPAKGFIFSLTGGEKPYGNLVKPKRKLDKLSGVKGWTLHDIRRTVRTGLSRLGVRPDVAERIIGHSVGGKLGETYDVYSYRKEKLEALFLWERYVLSAAAGTEAIAVER